MKPLNGYEGLYEISPNGDLLYHHPRWKYTKPAKRYTDRLGYNRVILYANDEGRPRRVDELVAENYLGYDPSDRDILVEHIDDDVSNDSADNLRLKKKDKNRTNLGPRKYW